MKELELKYGCNPNQKPSRNLSKINSTVPFSRPIEAGTEKGAALPGCSFSFFPWLIFPGGDRRRLLPARLRFRRPAYGRSKTLPGFRMPLGSRACLMAFMRASSHYGVHSSK